MLLDVRDQLFTVHLARRWALSLLDDRRLLSQISDRMFGGLLARETFGARLWLDGCLLRWHGRILGLSMYNTFYCRRSTHATTFKTRLVLDPIPSHPWVVPARRVFRT